LAAALGGGKAVVETDVMRALGGAYLEVMARRKAGWIYKYTVTVILAGVRRHRWLQARTYSS
jgi:hypothetical protein